MITKAELENSILTLALEFGAQQIATDEIARRSGWGVGVWSDSPRGRLLAAAEEYARCVAANRQEAEKNGGPRKDAKTPAE